jgi:2-phospho-L-lactate/phosphoenolpyruvate guanylyltransferase
MSLGWWFLLPVRTGGGKSRLTEDLFAIGESPLPHNIGLAFASDVLEALHASTMVRGITIVSGHEEWPYSVDLVKDRGEGLDVALQIGLDHLRSRKVHNDVAILLGDLPALTPAGIHASLLQASNVDRGFVRDADESGTVMITARRLADLIPHFGQGSAARHQAAGYSEILGTSDLRRDVDTWRSLEQARDLGVGMHTRIALEEESGAIATR